MGLRGCQLRSAGDTLVGRQPEQRGNIVRGVGQWPFVSNLPNNPNLQPLQYCFIGMSTRYDPPDTLLLYQQQKSHYHHLHHPRPSLKLPNPPNSSQHHKSHHSSRQDHRQRTLDNKKMLTTLLDIYNGQGLLERIERPQPRKQPSKTFYNEQSQSKSIDKANRELCFNIANAEPSIGTKQQWKKHYNLHKSLERRISHRGTLASKMRTVEEQMKKGRERAKVDRSGYEEDKLAKTHRKEEKKRKKRTHKQRFPQIEIRDSLYPSQLVTNQNVPTVH